MIPFLFAFFERNKGFLHYGYAFGRNDKLMRIMLCGLRTDSDFMNNKGSRFDPLPLLFDIIVGPSQVPGQE